MPPVMKDEKTRNWAELPPELTSLILLRLGTIEILRNAQKVCKSWRRVCKDPSMWRKIDLRNPESMEYDIGVMCRHAVCRSEGGLVEINTGIFGTDCLLAYIADRSSNLRCLRVAMYDTSSEGIVNAVMKLPLLEELEISHWDSQLNLKAVGHSCPFLKTLKVNRISIMSPGFQSDDDALAIAETMPELRHLELFGNRLLDTGLNTILDNCPHLEYLDLRQCFNVNLVGDLEKRCFERIKDLRRPNDSTADHPFEAFLCDTYAIEGEEEEEEEQEEEEAAEVSEDDYSYDDVEYVYDMSGDDVDDQSDMDDYVVGWF